MRIGFIIYGSLDTLTGGYLYDRIVAQGLEPNSAMRWK